ncbi:hypothetical protein Vafri_2705 [Volvox africanus]|uniref:Uncharacterized protein n=1 Tax=Volvox africanus TaxID=51714 RepID=A0A8J4EVL1_9CHLO|nr:hypothetical protein Vafri_2705 [Volvox africanus]
MKLHWYSVHIKAILAITLTHFASSAWDNVSTFARLCKPEAFGAAADGNRLDTNAVLQAITACKEGGTVLFEAGKTYRLGEITVTGRGIQLEVPPSATLLASAERKHYGAHQDTWYLLHFHRCFGCGLSGGGLIRGPAWNFVDNSTKPSGVRNWRDSSCRVRRQCRPRLVGVCRSSNVLIADLTLRDSAFWTLHIRDSDRVVVQGLTVEGDMDFPNNDGIDIDGSSHVTILQSHIATADDAVCIKSTSGGGRAVRHILVSNCTLQSRSAAVKLGSETRAEMSNITFSYLKVLDSNRGLAIQLRDHGNIRDVAFRNIEVATRRYPGRWWGGGEPIYVTALPRWLGSRVGRIVNVSFSNVVADVAGGVVVLAGSPESIMREVTLENMRITISPLAVAYGEAAAAVRTPAPSTAAAATAVPGIGIARSRVDAGAGNAGLAPRRAAMQVRAAVTATAGELPQVRAGQPEGDAAATQVMQLWVKLDLRPGPYGERRWLAAAPILAQFTQGLTVRNVSFEFWTPVVAHGRGTKHGERGSGSLGAEAGARMDEDAVRETRPGTSSSQASNVTEAQLASHLSNLPAGDGARGDASWYEELVQHTVGVQVAEQVGIRVVPAASLGLQALRGDGADVGQYSGAPGGSFWWSGGSEGLSKKAAWLCTVAVLGIVIIAAAATIV